MLLEKDLLLFFFFGFKVGDITDLVELCPLKILSRHRRIWRRREVFLGLLPSWSVSRTMCQVGG